MSGLFFYSCFVSYLIQREQQDDDFESEWIPDFSSMSPMERYHILEKPLWSTPDRQTLCILKLHHETRKIRKLRIKIPQMSGTGQMKCQNLWVPVLRYILSCSRKAACSVISDCHGQRKICL